MPSVDLTRDWQLVLGALPPDDEDLATKHEQLETKFGNAKIRTAEQLLRLLFVHVGADLPLRQTVALVAEAGGPEVSPNRLHMKLRRSIPYLQALLTRVLPARDDVSPRQWNGFALCAVDATVVCGPGATGTDARVHTMLALGDLAVEQAYVTDEHTGEALRNFRFRTGQLVLADRVHCNVYDLAHVRAADAHAHRAFSPHGAAAYDAREQGVRGADVGTRVAR